MLHRQYPEEKLIAVRRTYELQLELFAGRISASGKCHIEHGVGTAGILILFDAPFHLVLAAFIHNAYGLGDFGDGRKGRITPKRQSEICGVIGERGEQCVRRFFELPWNVGSVSQTLENFASLDEVTRETLVLRLADHLDHHQNSGLLYHRSDHMLTRLAPMRPNLSEMAKRLGYPQFIEHFDAVYAKMDRQHIPSCLRFKNPNYCTPRSYVLRPKLRWIARLSALKSRGKRIRSKIVARAMPRPKRA